MDDIYHCAILPKITSDTEHKKRKGKKPERRLTREGWEEERLSRKEATKEIQVRFQT